MNEIEPAIWLAQLNVSHQALNTACSEELLVMCAQHNQLALQELLSRYQRPVFGLLYRMLNNRQEAEEALSDVFVKVWKNAGKFKGDSKFTTWLYRIATNTARDYLRTRASKRSIRIESMSREDGAFLDIPAPLGDTPEAAVIHIDTKERIFKAIAKLSDDDRLLITLCHFEELSYDEISHITGISNDNLKVRLFRARQRLRKLYEEAEKDQQ